MQFYLFSYVPADVQYCYSGNHFSNLCILCKWKVAEFLVSVLFGIWDLQTGLGNHPCAVLLASWSFLTQGEATRDKYLKVRTSFFVYRSVLCFGLLTA